jgi:hypothetical protein
MVNQCSIVAFRSSGTMFRGKTLWIHTCLLRSSMIRLLRHSRSKGSILSWCTTWKECFETLQKKRIKLSQVFCSIWHKDSVQFDKLFLKCLRDSSTFGPYNLCTKKKDLRNAS